jgi:hypothetical protein
MEYIRNYLDKSEGLGKPAYASLAGVPNQDEEAFEIAKVQGGGGDRQRAEGQADHAKGGDAHVSSVFVVNMTMCGRHTLHRNSVSCLLEGKCLFIRYRHSNMGLFGNPPRGNTSNSSPHLTAFAPWPPPAQPPG